MCDWVKHAKAGDPVVCIDDSDYTRLPPKLGHVYLVRNFVFDSPHPDEKDMIELRVAGVNYPCNRLGIEMSWCAADFRPATSTDLPASIREALKTPAPKEKVNV